MKGQITQRLPDWEHHAYEDLAIAIIRCTARDYKKALIQLALHPDSKRAAHIRKECEDFFFSALFDTLTDADGYDLLLLIQNDAFATLQKKRKGGISSESSNHFCQQLTINRRIDR